MTVLHSASYRTSSGANLLPIETARTHHRALRDVCVLLREISSERGAFDATGVDLPCALGKALDAWLERRIS